MTEGKIHITQLGPGEIPSAFAENAGRPLVRLAAEHLGADTLRYALIHLDDGVLWGIVTDSQLSVPDAHEDWTPALRTVTVQQCRIFGDQGELFIWREAEGRWRGRVVQEGNGDAVAILDEPQILYGDTAHDGSAVHKLPPPPQKTGFTAIYERSKGTGIRQIVPLVAAEALAEGKRVILTVRHYLERDKDGQAKFFCSRLQSLETRRPN